MAQLVPWLGSLTGSIRVSAGAVVSSQASTGEGLLPILPSDVGAIHLLAIC